MLWIYLSSHLDDVALSCGGMVWEQVQAGNRVSIWTVCAGDPPAGPFSPFAQELHARWGTGPDAVQQRRQEDRVSCGHLGATARHLSIPDCIYRRNSSDGIPLYTSDEAIMGPIQPGETGLVQTLGGELAQAIPPEAEVVCPMAIGGHVDHRLTRQALEATGRRLWYYVDYPYILDEPGALEQVRQAGWREQVFSLTKTAMHAWEQAVAAYKSQISTFWPDLPAMQAALEAYCQQMGGRVLWQPKETG